MKKLLIFTIGLLVGTFLLTAGIARGATILFPVGGGTGSSTLTGILLGNGAAAVRSLTIGPGLSLVGTTLSNIATTFGYPFLGNATSTNITFSGGLTGNITGNASTATILQTTRTINGVNFNGSANITINAASSTLLGDNNTFSGNTIFSSLITGSLSGNAGTATKLATPRNINGVPFDGSAAITINAASSSLLGDSNTFSGTINKFSNAPALAITGLIKGNGTAAITAAAAGTDYQAPITLTTTGSSGAATFIANTLNVPQYAGTTYTPTWPITLTGNAFGFNGLSTTTNLSQGQLPYVTGVNTFGQVATTSVTCTGNATCTSFTAIGPSPITINVAAGTAASSTLLADNNTFSGNNTFSSLITGSISGNAGTATKWATGRTLSISGDLSYTSPSFDGSGNVTAAGTLATVNSNVGTFTNATFTVNGKGLVTGASNGTAPVTGVTATNPLFSTGGPTPNITTIFSTTSTWGLGNNGIVMTGATGFPFVVATSSPVNLNISGNAATVTTNANLTGVITSVGNTTSYGSQSAGVLGNSVTGNTSVQATSTLYGAVQNGKVLTGLNGVLAYVSTTTFSGALIYSGGNVTCQTATGSVPGCLSAADFTTFNAKQSALTFSTGLTNTAGTITVNTSQNISTLSNLTGNGFVKTSGSTGTLSIDTNTYLTAAGAVTSLAGTANQISVSASTGAVTLSIPALFNIQQSSTTMESTLGPLTVGTTSTTTIWGNATSTFNGGINIPTGKGCFAINSICLSSGSSFSGTTGQVDYFSGTNTAVGTSSIFISTASNIGIGTTSPFAKLSIQTAAQVSLSSSTIYKTPGTFTYVPSSGVASVVIQAWGAGGGGGGNSSSAGGAGAFVGSTTLTSAQVGASVTIKIGAGGLGGTGSAAGTGGAGCFTGGTGNGGSSQFGGGGGGSTCFGSFVIAAGGGGGGLGRSGTQITATQTTGGQGGNGSGSFGAGGGGAAANNGGNASAITGGSGGTGATPATGNSGAATNGVLGAMSAAGVSGDGVTATTNTGAVGSGGAAATTDGTGANSGGGGSAGNPASNGGTPAAGGGGSTSTGAGGTGGNGEIIVTEFFYTPLAAAAVYANTTPITFTSMNNQGVASFSIGTTTPSGILNVTSSALGTALFTVNPSGTIFAPLTTSSGSGQTGYWCYDASGQFIRDTGACIISAARYKQDIKPLPSPDALAEVLKLAPVSFFYKPDFNGSFQLNPNYSSQQVGFTADQVLTVDPRLVVLETATTTFEGKVYPPGTVQTVRYEQMTAVLAGAVQELNTKIENIKIGKVQRSVEENWQWGAIALLVLWNVALTVRRKK